MNECLNEHGCLYQVPPLEHAQIDQLSGMFSVKHCSFGYDNMLRNVPLSSTYDIIILCVQNSTTRLSNTSLSCPLIQDSIIKPHVGPVEQINK